MSRLLDIEKLEGVRIDFGGEEVTNLASLHEAVAEAGATPAIIEENVNVIDGTASGPSVSYLCFISHFVRRTCHCQY